MNCDARVLFVACWIDSEATDRIATCTLERGHDGEHVGKQDKPVTTYEGLPSKTIIHWVESDRRNFRGELRHCRGQDGCVLPDQHRGRHAR